MPRSPKDTVETTSGPVEVYSGTARILHWTVVTLIAIQVPIGLYMVYRGGTLNIWDATTNNLYSGHKLLGLIILAVMILRLAYRLIAGAPAHEPTLEPWQRVVSELTHWAIYALLIIVPILGYIGVSQFPALNIFGAFNLPGIVAPDKAMSETTFWWHATAAFALLGLIAMHIGAAMFHNIIRKDNVLGRMLPGALRKP
ncbi:MAG: cytochrome b [Alphaproteobacteria bacterium]|nr:cytochrome b [Alphaproteobacteria bacterium]